MTQAVKPMLATAPDWNLLAGRSMYGSAKVDGFRCMVTDGVAWSRTWKPFPNRSLQERVKEAAWVLEGLDGELVVGNPADPQVYSKTQSGVMSFAGDPEVTYLVFDLVNMPLAPFFTRLEALQSRSSQLPGWVRIHPQTPVHGVSEMEKFEEELVADGWEGMILRDPLTLYKHGRATARSMELLKVKRYADSEAVVTGFEELMHNGNAAFTDVQGHTKRTSHQAGKVPAGMLGALQVKLLSNPGVEFSIGTGFDTATRIEIWKNQQAYLSRKVTFKHMPHGALEAPRHPVFLGFRNEIDL